MRPLVFIVMALLPTLSIADMISVSVPSAVRKAVDGYRAKCTNEGDECIRLSPACPGSHHPNGPKASHSLTFNLDHSSGALC